MRRVIACTVVLALAGVVHAAPPEIELDRPFPDLVLPDLAEGKPTALADFRGEKVILEIFASW